MLSEGLRAGRENPETVPGFPYYLAQDRNGVFVYSYSTKQNGTETLIQCEDFTILPLFFFLANVCFLHNNKSVYVCKGLAVDPASGAKLKQGFTKSSKKD